jgi:hypothetical protein
MATQLVPEDGGSDLGVAITRFFGGDGVGLMFQFTLFNDEGGAEFCTVSVEELRARARQQTAHRESGGG